MEISEPCISLDDDIRKDIITITSDRQVVHAAIASCYPDHSETAKGIAKSITELCGETMSIGEFELKFFDIVYEETWDDENLMATYLEIIADWKVVLGAITVPKMHFCRDSRTVRQQLVKAKKAAGPAFSTGLRLIRRRAGEKYKQHRRGYYD